MTREFTCWIPRCFALNFVDRFPKRSSESRDCYTFYTPGESSSLSMVSKPRPLDTLLPGATRLCLRVRVRARLPRKRGGNEGLKRGEAASERDVTIGGGGEGDVHAWEEEKGFERDRPGVQNVEEGQRESDGERRSLVVRKREREAACRGGGIRLAKE